MPTPRDPLEPLFQDTGKKRWTNWHDFEHPVQKLVNVWNGQPDHSSVTGYNATTRGFQKAIGEALAAGQTLRGKGAGWSYSKVGTTNGVLLNTRPLSYRFQIGAGQTHPDFTGDAEHLAFVQCGNSIADLNHYLVDKGQSLKTSGASNGQTIVGAMSTGTHGAAIDVGAVPDFVVAIHLVVSPGRSVWLERASAPVVDDRLPGAFEAELIRDDELFASALVSLGSFGIVHGVVIETTDLFFLEAYRRFVPVDDGVWKAMEELDFSGLDMPLPGVRPHHFQFFVNPFAIDDGIYFVAMYKKSELATGCQAPTFGQLKPGDGALEVMGALTDIAPALTPALTGTLIRQLYKPYEKVCGTHGEIFTDTAVRGKSASSAVGLPLGRVREAFEIALQQVLADQVPVTMALRYVKGSDATLAFTRHSPQTCVLEIDGPRSNRVLTTYRRFWRRLEEAGIPFTFHWGKLNDLHLAPDRLRRMYGDRVDRWLEARRTLLPTTELRHLFANEFLHQAGLVS